MNYRNIHDFIKVLESSQELIRIKAPVSPYLEIAEITDRVSKSKEGGKALLNPDDLSRINIAFFHVNSVISVLLFASIMTEELVRRISLT